MYCMSTHQSHIEHQGPMLEGKKPDEEAIVSIRNELVALNDLDLAKNKYVAGDKETIADHAVFGQLLSLESIGFDLSKFENIDAYMARMKNETDFEKKYSCEWEKIVAWIKPKVETMLKVAEGLVMADIGMKVGLAKTALGGLSFMGGKAKEVTHGLKGHFF